jgi:hypothetical protein
MFMCIRVCMYMYMYMCTLMCACTCVCVSVRVYVCVCVCVCVPHRQTHVAAEVPQILDPKVAGRAGPPSSAAKRGLEGEGVGDAIAPHDCAPRGQLALAQLEARVCHAEDA